MTDLKQANLDGVCRRYLLESPAKKAFAQFSRGDGSGRAWDLRRLLRHHLDDPIELDLEVERRDAVDHLLAMYSSVEIAAIAGLVQPRLDKPFCKTAISFLSNPYVRRYYWKSYPLVLPGMLLTRLTRRAGGFPKEHADCQSLFMEFMRINGALETDPEIDMLLWFLDDGSDGSHDWSDAVGILRRPERLIASMLLSRKKRDAAQMAACGVPKYLSFCMAFDNLLSRSQRYPIFQAAMWHYHAYWFRIIRGDVRERMMTSLAALRSWENLPLSARMEADRANAIRAESAESLQAAGEAIKRLTSGRLGAALVSRQAVTRVRSAQALLRRRKAAS